MKIHNFSEFCAALLDCGFSMGGGNSKGIYAVIPYGWDEQDNIDSPVKWHTGNAETDPWEWRMRVLEQRDDIAYSKVFFRTSGYITREWYPYFYAVRRKGESFEEAYESGTISQTAKRIYDIISENGQTAFHEIKLLGGFCKEDNSKFERAIVELQMRMFIIMCGRAQKINKYGEGYGWSSTVFTTVEDFWLARGISLPDFDTVESYEKIKQIGSFCKEDNSKFERAIVELQMRMFITMCGRAQKINKYGEGYGWSSTVFTTVEDFWLARGISLPDFDTVESYEKIKLQVLKLNPKADKKKIDKFIKG